MPGNWTFIATLEKLPLMEHPCYINVYILTYYFAGMLSGQHIKEERNSSMGCQKNANFPPTLP